MNVRDADAPPVIRSTERAVCIGKPGSGKSVWCELHFAGVHGQAIAIDPKRELRRPGAHYAHGVRELDWKRRVQIFRPAKGDIAELDRLYAQILQRGNLTVWLDEAIGILRSNDLPDNLRNVLNWGRSLSIRHLTTGQRPVGMSPFVRSSADHHVIFARGMSDADLQTVAGDIGVTRKRLVQLLGVLQRDYGDRSMLHFEHRTNTIHLRPPIPRELLRAFHVAV